MKILINFCLVWFLVIQSIGMDARTTLAIPMQTEAHCKAAIETISIPAFAKIYYHCVDAGNIS
jgi:hypothetical protein